MSTLTPTLTSAIDALCAAERDVAETVTIGAMPEIAEARQRVARGARVVLEAAIEAEVQRLASDAVSDLVERLNRVKARLYDDRPLSPDQRRDLANTMDAILHPYQ